LLSLSLPGPSLLAPILLSPSLLNPSFAESELWMQMVLNLSQAQVQDLLFLRRLNLTRRCTLSTERKVLMHQMAASEDEALDNRSDNLQAVSLMATQLQQNAAEDRQVYYKLAKALYRGVSASTCPFFILVLCQVIPTEPGRMTLRVRTRCPETAMACFELAKA